MYWQLSDGQHAQIKRVEEHHNRNRDFSSALKDSNVGVIQCNKSDVHWNVTKKIICLPIMQVFLLPPILQRLTMGPLADRRIPRLSEICHLELEQKFDCTWYKCLIAHSPSCCCEQMHTSRNRVIYYKGNHAFFRKATAIALLFVNANGMLCVSPFVVVVVVLWKNSTVDIHSSRGFGWRKCWRSVKFIIESSVQVIDGCSDSWTELTNANQFCSCLAPTGWASLIPPITS